MKITLATLPQATAQQVFDQVAVHLLTQGEKSRLPDSECCRYRYGKLMCAAGCLIADNEYKVEFDEGPNCYWVDLAENDLVPYAHLDLIASLQIVHDDSPPMMWPDKLINVARIYRLSPAVVTNFKVQQ